MQPQPNDDISYPSSRSSLPLPSDRNHGLLSRDGLLDDSAGLAAGRRPQPSVSPRPVEDGTASQSSTSTTRIDHLEPNASDVNAFSPGLPPIERLDSHDSLASADSSVNVGSSGASASSSASSGFHVLPDANKNHASRVSLVDLPNEVLTHMLSHLPPATLAAFSRVSRRFHGLVTTPHAWRLAFTRMFPGRVAIEVRDEGSGARNDEAIVALDRRYFTCLTADATWRSEYILRTRLLRSVGRGKPAQAPAFSGLGRPGNSNAQWMYPSNLWVPVTHLVASFDASSQQRGLRFVHGSRAAGMVSTSDPGKARTENWGFNDPRSFSRFEQRFPGDALYGLGAGAMIGLPNPMDLSSSFGMICAEGLPAGIIYHRALDERRGRVLSQARSQAFHEHGVPDFDGINVTPCALWIAKTSVIPMTSEGLIGMLSGDSAGVVTAYSSGSVAPMQRRLERGEVTARWILSPGVPIIAFCVDEDYNQVRSSQGRAWAVALNALGEVFYLCGMPIRPEVPILAQLSGRQIDGLAWLTGRTVAWTLVEPSRRVAITDPYERASVEGSYTPRGSWNGMRLSQQQIAAETRELERFICQPPSYFQALCEGWDMQRRLLVDFASDHASGTGESILVISCGLGEKQKCSVVRWVRQTAQARSAAAAVAISANLPGEFQEALSPARSARRSTTLPDQDLPTPLEDTWIRSALAFGNTRSPPISAVALDQSQVATLRASEKTSKNDIETPMTKMTANTTSLDGMPGQGARFLAVGTRVGSIYLWNARAEPSMLPGSLNSIEPLRVIHTDSPRISCLALTSLYIVHGGSDGLVQAWDPLGSITQPIRTINSRLSLRMRRRVLPAVEDTALDEDANGAGAICLHPDPTVLCGSVALGSEIKCWSFSSRAADRHKGSRRRLRRSARSGQHGPVDDRGRHLPRGIRFDQYAVSIMEELREERKEQRENARQEARVRGRFGLDLLGDGATDAEMMAYATLLSEESAQSEAMKRANSSEFASEHGPATDSEPALSSAADDTDLAAALRESLDSHAEEPRFPSAAEEAGSVPAVDYPIQVRHGKQRRRSPVADATTTPRAELDDLDFALQLSLVEEQSRLQAADFPPLSEQGGSGSPRL